EYPLKLYLHYFLASQTDRLRAINQGAAQPNLNTGIVRAIDVPLPPTAEQTRIVAELERRLSANTRLLADISNSLDRAETLRSSLLRSAFNGTLVRLP